MNDPEFQQKRNLSIDYDALVRHFGGDQKIVEEICHCFLEEMPEKIQNFQTALKKEDKNELSRQAHALKGVSAHMRAPVIHRLSGGLEEACKSDDDWARLQALYANLEQEIENLIEIMKHPSFHSPAIGKYQKTQSP